MRCSLKSLRSIIRKLQESKSFRVVDQKIELLLSDNIHLAKDDQPVRFHMTAEFIDQFLSPSTKNLYASLQDRKGYLSVDFPVRDYARVVFPDLSESVYELPTYLLWVAVDPDDSPDWRPEDGLPEDYYAL